MTAWIDGYYCRLRFGLTIECPYPFGSKLARAWCAGYREAMKEEDYEGGR